MFEFFQVKLLLTQKSLSVSALPVLRNGYDSRQFERLFLKHSSISPVDCSWKSETLSISATLRENGVSPARQEDCLWLSAEGEELVCLCVLFPAALCLLLHDME